MSCPCQTNNGLPLITDDVPVQSTLPATTCCDDQTALPSSPTDGSDISSWATDAACYNENVVLLGRVGNRLARLVGSGFIAITNGYASIVQSVPLKVRDLWHRWWKSSPTATPVLGAPQNFPYQVIADSYGELHAIKGGEYDSVKVWDASEGVFVDTELTDLPKCQKGVINRAPVLELVGYEPIPEQGSETAERCLKGLTGSGLVIASERDTVASACPQGDEVVTVMSTFALPEPVADETYVLKFSTALGLHWVDETPN